MESVTVKVELRCPSDLHRAYEEAIKLAHKQLNPYADELDPNFWEGTITLKTIEFESNYSREYYVAVFEVTEG